MGILTGKTKYNIKKELEREQAIKRANKLESDKVTLREMLRKAKPATIGLIVALMGLFWAIPAKADTWADFTNEQVADAIYQAEGVHSKHPYGILTKYKHTTPRQACLNTIKNHRKRHANHNCGLDFIGCLGARYCPIGAKNDPTGLNKNWIKNVKHFLETQN